jgi:hypothetical protein
MRSHIRNDFSIGIRGLGMTNCDERRKTENKSCGTFHSILTKRNVLVNYLESNIIAFMMTAHATKEIDCSRLVHQVDVRNGEKNRRGKNSPVNYNFSIC